MSDASSIKRLLTLHSLLSSASHWLNRPIPSGIPDQMVHLDEAESLLSMDALQSWMTDLERAGLDASPPAAFWREMERAAQALQKAEIAARSHARFLATVKGKTG